MTDLVAQLVGALEELFATVMGECPQLLDEDRGGSANLYFAIQDALSAAKDGGWVSVSDRLPEKYVEVLIAFGGIAVPSTGQYTGNEHDVNGWLYPSENFGITDQGGDPIVSHWRPLPNPPKGEV